MTKSVVPLALLVCDYTYASNAVGMTELFSRSECLLPSSSGACRLHYPRIDHAGFPPTADHLNTNFVAGFNEIATFVIQFNSIFVYSSQLHNNKIEKRFISLFAVTIVRVIATRINQSSGVQIDKRAQAIFFRKYEIVSSYDII